MNFGDRYAAQRLLVGAVGLLLATVPAQAQELTHEFIDPSFGGNPFNSDHLLAIANLDRPKAPEDPADPAPTPEELLVSQLQAQLNSTLSSNVLRAIQSAQPGQSGQFTLGDTVVSYTRTATETRVTFVNSKTGETREIVIPVSSTGSPLGANSGSQISAEGILSVTGRSIGLSSTNPAIATGEAGLLLSPPPL